MSRWFFPWSSSIKKRACRYLLQHYLGHYLEERLSLEQLSLDLYQGAGALTDIHLDIWSVNELLESVNAPLEITDGFINSISVTIPWSALVTENCTVEVSGLQITCRPKYRGAAPGAESQSWSSCMTTSMQLAQECLKDQAEEPSDAPQPLEGLEMFAQTIETVLRRIKVTFLDTVVRVEHTPSGSHSNVALEVHIKRLDYCDEAVKDPSQVLPVDIHQPPAFVHKILQLSGMVLYYEEIPEGGATPPPYPPDPEESFPLSAQKAPEPQPAEPPSPLLQIGSCSGYMEMMIKLKQNEAFPGPKPGPPSLPCSSLPAEASGLREQLSKSRPLDSEDLKLIEQDLSQQLHAGLGASPARPDEMESFLGLGRGEMFFSMAHMSSSATSVRSTSDLSDIDLDSSTHSDRSSPCHLQPPSFAPGLILSSPRRYGQSPFAATLPGLPGLGKMPGEWGLCCLRPETLLRVTVGGLTVTVLHQSPGPGPPCPHHPQLARRFFTDLGFFKDSAFGGRNFQPLRQSFEKACPHSNFRLTGAAVQVSCEHKAAGNLQVFSWDVCFGLLEILECLWSENRQLKPDYTENPPSPSSVPRRAGEARSALEPPPPHSTCVRAPPPQSRLRKDSRKRSSELWADLAEFHSDVDLVPPRQASVQLTAPKATLRVQFPVPDLRPQPECRPWAEKAVRKESLRLELADVMFRTELQAAPGAAPEPTRLETTFSDLHGVYEDVERLSVPCIRVSKALDPTAKGSGKKYAFPKISLSLNPWPSDPQWDLGLDKSEEMGLSSVESPCELKQPEPSPFSSKRTMYETEEMVIPGDPEEMAEFQAKTLAASQYALEVTMPSAHIFLPSKEFYESIYNRINNDLLMWEPSSPLHGSAGPAGGAAFFSGRVPAPPYWQEKFKLCKSAFKLDSDSEDEDSHFYSVDEATAQRKKKEEQRSHRPQSCFAAAVTILKGRVTALCDAKVRHSKSWGGGGIPTLNSPPPSLHQLIGVRSWGGGRGQLLGTRQLLLIDFLDVLDDPILGFVPPRVITVLHTHLFCCAVDYRPLYLPVQVLITAETFTLSSNIIVDTSIFLLRFILDDSAIYLSDKCDAEAVDLRKDYVCVLDVDLLELVITTWKGATAGKLTQPLFELRCSNNVVHLHTCADSCAALANLLQYVVNHGDLHPPPRHDSPTEIAGQKVQLSESPASLPHNLPAETAVINQRDLTDALIDTERGLRDPSADPASPVSVYLFPGENGAGGKPRAPDPVAPAEEGLDFCSSEGSEEESEATDTDDFCILDAPGTGIPPKDGEPVVTKLLEGPVCVRDGYFSRPLGSTDLLKAPAHFSVPESRIMLREISVVWLLYGGRDFGTSGHSHSPSARSSPSRSSVTNRPQNTWRAQGGTGRIHDLLMEIQLTKVSFQHETYPSAPEKLALEPEEQPLARQVFIVQELEVRDRLASSQINKFLYLYSSERMPRRAHSNMLTIKALHISPEAGLGGPECCLRVSLMPLRLNIDQDALFFLKDFFTSLAAGINPVVPVEVGTEGEAPGLCFPAASYSSSQRATYSAPDPSQAALQSSSLIGWLVPREFRFTSEVPIWLDYHGKHVTMDQVGTFAGILIGLAQLNCSELKLKRLCCRHGLLGVDKVVNYALSEWLTDIRKNQLPGILGGVGPMHSVVQLCECLGGGRGGSQRLLGGREGVQGRCATAETVYDILSPTTPVTRTLLDKKYARKLRRGQQPADLREGMAKAYDTFREGVIDTAQTICDVAARGHEQKGITGAVGGVLRQIPPTVVKPLIMASEATSNLLGGMRNQIKPDARKEESLKWRSDDPQE
uniref:Autophagy related 2A n=1 Tax=Sphenodon punctatus TaxID=8508 RepID=A0A8D0LD16_SPHPU